MNNKNFTIISDGSCDLPDEIVKEKDIKVVPFTFHLMVIPI